MTIAIEVKGLIKIYNGKVRALDGVDLSVKAGDVFALLGPKRNQAGAILQDTNGLFGTKSGYPWYVQKKEMRKLQKL